MKKPRLIGNTIIHGERMTEDDYQIKKRKRKRSNFQPDSDFINDAVEEYLKAGGKITRVEIDEEAYRDFISRSDARAADEFLNEG